jgi:hypothetical protein
MNIDTFAVVISTALGPVLAVMITLWHQERSQRRNAEERLFITLMAHRKLFPPAHEWVRALNLIEVVYSRHPKVIDAWHSFYDYIHVNPIDAKQFEHRHLNLLSEMAIVLGYKNLKQTDIDKFYSPQVHGDQAVMQAQLQKEIMGFFRAIQEIIAQQKTVPPETPIAGKQ